MRHIASIVVVAAAGLLAVGGCADVRTPAPEARVTVSNPAYAVDRLFTDEQGNSVYRFRDRGGYLYYVAGPRGTQMVPPPTQPAAGTPIPEAN